MFLCCTCVHAQQTSWSETAMDLSDSLQLCHTADGYIGLWFHRVAQGLHGSRGLPERQRQLHQKTTSSWAADEHVPLICVCVQIEMHVMCLYQYSNFSVAKGAQSMLVHVRYPSAGFGGQWNVHDTSSAGQSITAT